MSAQRNPRHIATKNQQRMLMSPEEIERHVDDIEAEGELLMCVFRNAAGELSVRSFGLSPETCLQLFVHLATQTRLAMAQEPN